MSLLQSARLKAAWHDSTLRRLVANSSWLLAARGVNAPLALVESVVLARFLGVEAFGTLGLVMAVVIVVQRLFSFRMNEFTVRYLSGALEKGDTKEAGATLRLAGAVEACSAVVAGSLAYLSAPLLAGLFVSSADSAGLIRLFAFICLVNGLSETSTGALEVFDHFRILAAANVVRKVLSVAGLALFLLVGSSVALALVIYISANLLANAGLVTFAVRAANRALGARWWSTPAIHVRRKWREMGHFALTTNLGATLSLIIKDSDLLWVGFFQSPLEAGYFKLATTFLKVPFAAGSPLTRAFFPEVARLAARRPVREIRRFLKHSTLISLAWVGPVALLTALAAPFLIRLLYGRPFLPALPALWILLVGLTAAHVVFWTRPTLLALGHPEIPLKIAIVNAVLKIILALAVVPTWGYLGLSAILSGLYLNGLTLGVLAVKTKLEDRSHDRS